MKQYTLRQFDRNNAYANYLSAEYVKSLTIKETSNIDVSKLDSRSISDEALKSVKKAKEIEEWHAQFNEYDLNQHDMKVARCRKERSVKKHRQELKKDLMLDMLNISEVEYYSATISKATDSKVSFDWVYIFGHIHSKDSLIEVMYRAGIFKCLTAVAVKNLYRFKNIDKKIVDNILTNNNTHCSLEDLTGIYISTFIEHLNDTTLNLLNICAPYFWQIDIFSMASRSVWNYIYSNQTRHEHRHISISQLQTDGTLDALIFDGIVSKREYADLIEYGRFESSEAITDLCRLLNDRQIKALKLTLYGYKQSEIALLLNISLITVKRDMKSIKEIYRNS